MSKTVTVHKSILNNEYRAVQIVGLLLSGKLVRAQETKQRILTTRILFV